MTLAAVGLVVATLMMSGCSAVQPPAPSGTTSASSPASDTPSVSISFIREGKKHTITADPGSGLCTSSGAVAVRAKDEARDAGVTFTASTAVQQVAGFARGDGMDAMFSGRGEIHESERDGKRAFVVTDATGSVNVADAGTGRIDLMGVGYTTIDDATMSFTVICPSGVAPSLTQSPH